MRVRENPALRKGWRWQSIGEIGEAIRGVTFSSTETSQEPFENGIACLTTSGVQSDVAWTSRRYIPVDSVSSDDKILRTGDILISTANSKELVGKSCVVKEVPYPCTFGAFVTVIRPNPKLVDSSLLAYWLQTSEVMQHFYKISSETTNISNLRITELAEVELPMPPLPEQQRIAAHLDKADRLRRLRRYALDLGETYLQSVFLEMFGDLPHNGKGWEIAHLDEVVQPDRGVTYGIVQAGPHVPDGIPYIKTGDIVDGTISPLGLSRTSKEIAESYRRSEVKYGDIVFSIRATVGTCALLPPELDGANLTQGTARIAPGDTVDRFYLLWMLRSLGMQDWFRKQVKGSTFFEITLTRLREAPVMVPPLALQEKFAGVVRQYERLRAQQRESLRQAEMLFGALLEGSFQPHP